MTSRKDKLSDLFDEALTVSSEDYLAESPLLQELEACTERYSGLEFYQRGGSKVIYRAQDEKTGRRVALANLQPDPSMSQIDSFLREARINALLQHPNIVPVYDIGVLNDEPYFCMKFIGGDSLAKILDDLKEGIKSSVFPRTVLLDVFLKICDAIAYAHAHGVLHLDLKPENIRIDDFGDVLVCDWGLARVLDGQEAINDNFGSLENYSLSKMDLANKTVDGFIKGTPGYMAPEQTGRCKFAKGISTDTYALGGILYTLLCYERPFSGELEVILEKTAVGDFPPPSQVRPEVPARLEAICLKAMGLNPVDRYQSVQELHEDILAYRNGYATSAEEVNLLVLSKLFIQRNKVLSSVVSLAILILLIFTLLFIRGLEESRNEALTARNQAQSAESAALELAERFRREKEENEKRGKVLSVQFIGKYKRAYEDYNFPDALDYVNSAVKLDPLNREAWFFKAQLHCIYFQFSESLTAYEKAKKTDSLYDIARKYADDPRPVDAHLKLEVVAEAMKKHGRNRPASDFVHHQAYSEIPLTERIIFVRGILKLFNPQQQALNYSFDKNLRHLDVSGNKQLSWAFVMQNFPAKSVDISRSGINHFKNIMSIPLQELNASSTPMSHFSHLELENLRVLNISRTQITDLAPLSASPLQILDISFCRISSLAPLKKMKFLRNLTISKRQFTLQQLSQLPARIEIKVVK